MPLNQNTAAIVARAVKAENERFRSQISPLVAGYDIVVLMGQSNMVGRGGPVSATLDATNDRILQFGNSTSTVTLASDPLDHLNETANTVGLGLSFAKDYLETISSVRKVLLIPAAKGATSFYEGFWQTGGDGLEGAITQTNLAMAAGVGVNQVVAFLWHQGERDAGNDATEAEYDAYLDSLIASLRARIDGADSTTPFVCGQLVPGWDLPASQPVRDSLANLPNRIAYTGFANSTSLVDNGDDVHFNAASIRTLGERYFTALQVAIDNSSPGVIEVEPLADRHWVFGESSTSLTDLINSTTLTKAGADPVYASTYLTTANSAISGLISDIQDSIDQTFITVFRCSSSQISSIIGGVLTLNSGDGGTAALVNSSSRLAVNMRGLSSQEVIDPMPQDVWLFLAVVSTGIGGNSYIHWLGDRTTPVVNSAVTGGTKTVASLNVACGNGHYNTAAFNVGLDLAEFIIVDSALTTGQIEAVYARSITRMAGRGITLE